MHYLTPLLGFIIHHSMLAYGAIFLISLSESLALVGLLVPGTVIMFGVGAVVSTGSLKLTPVLLMAMAGAVAGDCQSLSDSLPSATYFITCHILGKKKDGTKTNKQ